MDTLFILLPITKNAGYRVVNLWSGYGNLRNWLKGHPLWSAAVKTCELAE